MRDALVRQTHRKSRVSVSWESFFTSLLGPKFCLSEINNFYIFFTFLCILADIYPHPKFSFIFVFIKIEKTMNCTHAILTSFVKKLMRSDGTRHLRLKGITRTIGKWKISFAGHYALCPFLSLFHFLCLFLIYVLFDRAAVRSRGG